MVLGLGNSGMTGHIPQNSQEAVADFYGVPLPQSRPSPLCIVAKRLVRKLCGHFPALADCAAQTFAAA